MDHETLRRALQAACASAQSQGDGLLVDQAVDEGRKATLQGEAARGVFAAWPFLEQHGRGKVLGTLRRHGGK
jgi:hypothetical protein